MCVSVCECVSVSVSVRVCKGNDIPREASLARFEECEALPAQEGALCARESGHQLEYA